MPSASLVRTPFDKHNRIRWVYFCPKAFSPRIIKMIIAFCIHIA